MARCAKAGDLALQRHGNCKVGSSRHCLKAKVVRLQSPQEIPTESQTLSRLRSPPAISLDRRTGQTRCFQSNAACPFPSLHTYGSRPLRRALQLFRVDCRAPCFAQSTPAGWASQVQGLLERRTGRSLSIGTTYPSRVARLLSDSCFEARSRCHRSISELHPWLPRTYGGSLLRWPCNV